ncbi:MAG: DNA mismatch repair endonuclease MutL [bacterium]
MDPGNNKIKILPENLTNKIAAGEVVDRPASVIKELVENSIDAGATEITVILKDGGRALMQVVDNGSGMSQEDLLLAFQRHATSKIHSLEDLERISTLGFRGEALASIASVSRVEAKSVVQGASEGSVVRIEGGTMDGIEASGGNSGTSVAVKHIFYNTPARRKFLRATRTEYRQILNVMHRFLLAFPEIAFTLVEEGELVYELPAHGIEERIRAVLGERVQKNLLAIENEGHINITGFVGNQDLMRRSRGDQYLFLNKRYFVNKSLNYAVVSAYGEILARGYYPVYIINLALDPEQVDVNVHPAKMEVKFANDNLIFSSLRGAIKRALSSGAVVPHISSFRSTAPNVTPAIPADQIGFQFGKVQKQPSPSVWPVENDSETVQPAYERQPPLQERHSYERTNVWQIHNKYILSQIKTGLIIIDQHVAHERILYEQALENFEQGKPCSQQLLFPQIIELSAENYVLFLEMLPFLERIGFIVKAFGKNTVMLEGVPSGIKISDDEKVLLNILDEYKRGKRENIEIRDNVAKSYACHSAIRAGEPLTLAAMNALIDQLFSTKEPYFCPHGRPVLINIPLDELDRRFRRR